MFEDTFFNHTIDSDKKIKLFYHVDIMFYFSIGNKI